MRISILHNLNRYRNDREAEFDLPITLDALAFALSKRHTVSLIEASKDIRRWIDELTSSAPDLVFNVAEGFMGAAREALYPAILENLGIPYSGPGPTELLICHNKQLTKRLVVDHGVPIAWGAIILNEKCIQNLPRSSLPFPLIVKLNSEGSSLGMDTRCIVNDYEELHSQVRSVRCRFSESILIEEYVHGRDLSCSFIEGLGTFGPVEYKYPYGSIYDYELKTASNDLVSVVSPDDILNETKDQLRTLTTTIAEILGVRGYGRADFRLCPNGGVRFLEFNAQVSFHPDGAFVLSAQHAGLSFDEVVLHVVERAALSVRSPSSIARWDHSSSIRP